MVPLCLKSNKEFTVMNESQSLTFQGKRHKKAESTTPYIK
jgi:hypothetical protein